MLGRSGRFEADAPMFEAIYWRHGSGNGGGKGFAKGFCNEVCKDRGEGFFGNELAIARDDEYFAGRLRRFGKGSSKPAKSQGKAFSMTPDEKSRPYERCTGKRLPRRESNPRSIASVATRNRSPRRPIGRGITRA